ncbi:MAG: hypothetical protein JWP81_158 [Ferruginibacter sp.]|nr:hypothetical protein [Ferruginibacter sp.]
MLISLWQKKSGGSKHWLPINTLMIIHLQENMVLGNPAIWCQKNNINTQM